MSWEFASRVQNHSENDNVVVVLECIITNIRTERDRFLPSRQWNKSPNDYDGSFKCSKYYLPSRVIYSSLQIGERCSFLEISTFQFWPDLLHTKQAWLSTPSKGESEMKKKLEIVINASWISFFDDLSKMNILKSYYRKLNIPKNFG